MPGSLVSQYSFWNAGSVPDSCVTLYCSGVSRDTVSGSLRYCCAISRIYPPRSALLQPAPPKLGYQLRPAIVEGARRVVEGVDQGRWTRTFGRGAVSARLIVTVVCRGASGRTIERKHRGGVGEGFRQLGAGVRGRHIGLTPTRWARRVARCPTISRRTCARRSECRPPRRGGCPVAAAPAGRPVG